MTKHARAVKRNRLRSFIASAAAGALIAGSLVAVGVGAQVALAGSPAPSVSVTQQDPPFIAGEDLTVEVEVRSAGAAAGDEFNLGVAVLIPADATLVGTSAALGAPRVYGAGQPVPSQGADCASVGLAGSGVTCAVPAGAQYLVFQNVSDLPEGAANSGTLTLRPDAAEFPVGSTFDVRATAFTSDDERHLPSFPGSTNRMPGIHTSAPGGDELGVAVQALRLEKQEPSPEGELLRGVHLNTTTYTLRVWHTGEGDIADTEVVDFLPAGLEYLGMGGVDHTAGAANGTQPDSAEYPGAPSLAGTPEPAGAGVDVNAGTVERSVETVIPTADEVARYGLEAGKVYTRVVWDLGALLAGGDARDIQDPLAQDYANAAGVPGYLEIRYRAGVPLFENTLDFGYTADTTGQQTANLDNNRGASTRHGEELPGENGAPLSLRNVAGVSGTYAGPIAPGHDPVSTDTAEHTVDAVDVRVLKSVDDSTFEQGQLATYTLDIATSEYTAASLGDGGSEDVRPNRLTDDLGDGICPAIPAGGVTPGIGDPRLVIGDPRPGGAVVEDDMTPAEWTAALGELGTDCAYPSGLGGAELSGATLSGIAFDPASGHFYLDLSIAPIAAGTGSGHDGGSAGHQVVYTAAQNALYAEDAHAPGVTTSGDRVTNTVELAVTTDSIDALDGVTSSGDPANGVPAAAAAGEWHASDDSSATLEASLSRLAKSVLPRDTAIPAGGVADVPDSAWEPETAREPFAAGDEVWWRITVTPPFGADVRNPKLTDFLPEGTAFDTASTGGRYDSIVYSTSAETALGVCAPTGAAWLDEFVQNPVFDPDGDSLTWELGSDACVPSDTDDRFFPRNTTIDIFVKVQVVDVAAFSEVDLSANLAKYQQENVEGEIFFLRDEAAVQMDTGARLIKGVRAIDGDPAAGNPVNSNVDHREVVQNEAVEFRLDVTAPSSTTSAYVLYDALPAGIRAEDLDGYDAGTAAIAADAKLWEDGADGASAAVVARAYNPGDAGYPGDVSAAYSGRSVVVWELQAEVPGSTPPVEADAGAPAVPGVERGFTLAYTVIVPDGSAGGGAAALLSQSFENTASIVEFQVSNNTGGSSTIVPTLEAGQTTAPNGGGSGSSAPVADRPVADGEFGVTAAQATDPSDVFLPGAEIEKTLVETEIGPNSAPNPPGGANDLDANNPDNAIVQGEYATFDYSVTVPAHTSVREGVLADFGNFVGQGSGSMTPNTAAYQVQSATLVEQPAGITVASTTGADPAVHATEFGFRTDTGKLVFPSYYDVAGEPATFTVRVVVWTNDVDASHPTSSASRPSISNNKMLRNTAYFDSKTLSGGQNPRVQDSADVQYREPNLTIAKSANPQTDVEAGELVTYTLSITNPNRVKSYDNTVVDTVPSGLIVDTAQAWLFGATFLDEDDVDTEASLNAGTGGTITWSSEQFPDLAEIPGTATLSYAATIDPTTGAGRSYTNTATVSGFTLPSDLPDAESRRGDRTSTDDATISAITAAIDKGVRLADAVPAGAFGPSVSAPIGDTVEYQVDVTLRANVNYYDPRIVDDLPTGVSLVEASIVGPEVVAGTPALTGSWNRTSGAGNVHEWRYDGDIASAGADRTLRLGYRVDLTNSVPFSTNSLPNTAVFSWNTVDGDEGTRQQLDDPAGVTVLNPQLEIVKRVDGQDAVTRNPDATLPYTLTVTNTGGTPAHHITVTDEVPDGIVVDADSISDGGVLTGAGATGGGTITWSLAGPLDHQGGAGTDTEILLTYSAEFADSAQLQANGNGLGTALTNTADVTRFESFADEGSGREYTPGRNGQPPVRDTAEARPLFPQVTLDKTVSDGDLAHVGESFGWTLTLVNAGQGAAQTIDVADVLPKNWSYDDGSAMISVGGAAAVPLAAPVQGTDDGKTSLAWSLGSIAPATPILPGAASGATDQQRTIVITFTATPGADAVTDAGAGLTVPHTNTLSASTTDTTGATGNASEPSFTADPDTADAFLGSADLTIEKTGAADPILAGTEASAWEITVSNNGPDTADGSITVSDTTGPLPAGVVVTDVSGAGWTCSVPVRDADTGATAFDCARTDTAEQLADGASFPVIEVQVSVAADQAPITAAGELVNTAEVHPGRTHDDDPDNNESSDDITTGAAADLAVEKTVSTASPTAGAGITWQIAPSNLGPSVSVSTDDTPITISDTIPNGVSGVTFADGTGTWTADTPAGGSWNAGDTITWTYTGSAMPVGAAAVITLSGTIDASWTGGEISNTAVIEPGVTPDPETPNNTSTVPVTPGDATTLGIAKTRVVWDAAADDWVAATEAAQWGDEISYLVRVVNQGPADARAVTVVDEVPAGLTFSSLTDVAGTWTRVLPQGGTNAAGTTNASWETFALTGTQQVGETAARAFVVTFDTDSTMDPDTEIVNWVEASAENATNDPRDDDRTGSSRVADLSVTKSHTGSAEAGSTLDYTIVATNHGPSVSDGPIVITDSLPDGFSYVAGSAMVSIAGAAPVAMDPVITEAGQLLTWTPVATGATLARDATIEITLTTAIDAKVPAQLDLVNRATVDAPEDPNPDNDYRDDSTEVETHAEMTIVKDVEPGPWIAGTEVAYTLTVTNDGPSAVAASVEDVLPAGLTLVSISGAGWTCDTVSEGATSGSCDFTANDGLHPVGAANATTLSVVALIASNVPTMDSGSSPLVNTAELTWVDTDGPQRDEDTAEILVTTEADLGLVKTAVDPADDTTEVGTAVAGEQARYRIDVENFGPSDAIAPITVADTLPDGISFAGLAGGASANWAAAVDPVDPQRVTFTLLPDGTGLAAGQATPAILFDVRLDPGLQPTADPDVPALVNTATVTSGTPDPNPANDTDEAPLTVTRAADLAIVKSHEAERVRIGDELPFSLLVSNNGPSVASGITVTDRVPAGLEVLSAAGDEADGWTIVSVTAEADGTSTVLASRSDAGEELAVGDSAPALTVLTRVLESAYPSVVNVAEVRGAEPDGDPSNNTSEDEVAVPPMVTLVTEKTAVGEFQVGGTGTYRITVENLGPTADPGPITVTDSLPDGLSFRSSPDEHVSVSGDTVTWTLPDGLQVGERVDLTLVVDVGQAAYPSVTNVVSIDTPSELTDDSQTEDSAVVPVAAADPLAITGADLAAFAALAALLLVLAGAGALLLERRRRAGQR